MKIKILLIIAIALLLCSCVKHEGSLKVYPAKEYLVASDRGCWANGNDGWEPYYFVKEKGESEWDRYDRIQGLDYEPGYEYRIKAEKIKDKDLLKIADGPSYIYLRLVTVLSSEQRTTENLPDNYIPYSEELPPPSEYYN